MRKHYFLLLPVLITCFSMQVSAQVNLQQGLVAYYPFNGNANDESGNGNHGVVYGATLSEDRFGNGSSAYYMDGNDYINIGQLSQLNNADGITISVWVKRFTSGRKEGFIGKWNSGEYSNNVFLIYNGEQSGVNKPCFCFQAKNTPARKIYSNYLLSSHEWVNIISTWNNTNGISKIFINGQKSNEKLNDQTIGKKLNYNTSYPAIIGNWGRFWGSNYYLIGKIDDIRIYNRALTEQEIHTLYIEGQPPQTNTISNILISQRNDGSGMVDVYFNLNGTGSQYNITLAASFDGGNTYTAIPASFLSGDVSNISPGTNKHIIWDGLGSHPNTYSTATKLKIIAN
jgi:hypothetical protein